MLGPKTVKKINSKLIKDTYIKYKPAHVLTGGSDFSLQEMWEKTNQNNLNFIKIKSIFFALKNIIEGNNLQNDRIFANIIVRIYQSSIQNIYICLSIRQIDR